MSTDYAQLNTTARDRLLALMLDLDWHDYRALREVAGVRYGARLLELKRLGYEVEDEPLGDQGKRYRLVDAHPACPQGKLVRVYLSPAEALSIIGGAPVPSARGVVRDALASYRANEAKL